jgi:hypothetical protein
MGSFFHDIEYIKKDSRHMLIITSLPKLVNINEIIKRHTIIFH